MNSEITYYSIYKLLEPLSFAQPLKENFAGKGNLAYFIDAYSGTEELEKIYKEILSYVKENDVNNVCNLIGESIYRKAKEADVEAFYHDKYFITHGLMEMGFKEGNLMSFSIVGKELFPEWFQITDYIIS